MRRTPFAHIIILIAFIVNTFGPVPANAQELVLPKPGVMVHLSPPMNPPVLKGIKVHADNPFRFDFVLDRGDSVGNADLRSLQDESKRLIKYFLASLTIPEKDLWVNLSPYEKDRIVPESFGVTEMGRDLLAEDYMLKQITASLIYPEGETGKKFWKRIYEEAQKKYGNTNIPVNTFNKVWIVPEKAVVYENAKAGTAYVVESKLKVMLEQDYLSLSKHDNEGAGHAQPVPGADVNQLGSQIVREIVIPELTREVNEGKNFVQLRQVYNSLILATWYKKKIKNSILSQVYADKSKTQGVNIDDPQEKEKIYQQYLKAFKKGVYNYIKDEPDPITNQTTPRKYFSGGLTMNSAAMNAAMKEITDVKVLPSPAKGSQYLEKVEITQAVASSAMAEDGVTGSESPAQAASSIREFLSRLNNNTRFKVAVGYLRSFVFPNERKGKFKELIDSLIKNSEDENISFEILADHGSQEKVLRIFSDKTAIGYMTLDVARSRMIRFKNAEITVENVRSKGTLKAILKKIYQSMPDNWRLELHNVVNVNTLISWFDAIASPENMSRSEFFKTEEGRDFVLHKQNVRQIVSEDMSENGEPTRLIRSLENYSKWVKNNPKEKLPTLSEIVGQADGFGRNLTEAGFTGISVQVERGSLLEYFGKMINLRGWKLSPELKPQTSGATSLSPTPALAGKDINSAEPYAMTNQADRPADLNLPFKVAVSPVGFLSMNGRYLYDLAQYDPDIYLEASKKFGKGSINRIWKHEDVYIDVDSYEKEKKKATVSIYFPDGFFVRHDLILDQEVEVQHDKYSITIKLKDVGAEKIKVVLKASRHRLKDVNEFFEEFSYYKDIIEVEIPAAVNSMDQILMLRKWMDEHEAKGRPLIITQIVQLGALYPLISEEIKRRFGVVEIGIDELKQLVEKKDPVEVERFRNAPLILFKLSMGSSTHRWDDFESTWNIKNLSKFLRAPIMMIDHSVKDISNAEGNIKAAFDKEPILEGALFSHKLKGELLDHDSFVVLFNAHFGPDWGSRMDDSAFYDEAFGFHPQMGSEERYVVIDGKLQDVSLLLRKAYSDALFKAMENNDGTKAGKFKESSARAEEDVNSAENAAMKSSKDQRLSKPVSAKRKINAYRQIQNYIQSLDIKDDEKINMLIESDSAAAGKDYLAHVIRERGIGKFSWNEIGVIDTDQYVRFNRTVGKAILDKPSFYTHHSQLLADKKRLIIVTGVYAPKFVYVNFDLGVSRDVRIKLVVDENIAKKRAMKRDGDLGLYDGYPIDRAEIKKEYGKIPYDLVVENNLPIDAAMEATPDAAMKATATLASPAMAKGQVFKLNSILPHDYIDYLGSVPLRGVEVIIEYVFGELINNAIEAHAGPRIVKTEDKDTIIVRISNFQGSIDFEALRTKAIQLARDHRIKKFNKSGIMLVSSYEKLPEIILENIKFHSRMVANAGYTVGDVFTYDQGMSDMSEEQVQSLGDEDLLKIFGLGRVGDNKWNNSGIGLPTSYRSSGMDVGGYELKLVSNHPTTFEVRIAKDKAMKATDALTSPAMAEEVADPIRLEKVSNVLVAGSSGDIGASLVRYIHKQGVNLKALFRNQQSVQSYLDRSGHPLPDDSYTIADLFNTERFSNLIAQSHVFYHLFGVLDTPTREVEAQNIEIISANVLLATKLIRIAAQVNPDLRYVYTSTRPVADIADRSDVNEWVEHALDFISRRQSLIDGVSNMEGMNQLSAEFLKQLPFPSGVRLYVLTKYLVEKYLERSKLNNFICLRATSVYGPGSLSERSIKRLIEARVLGRSMKQANRVGTYIYMDDLVEIMYRVGVTDEDKRISPVVASDEHISLRDVWAIIEDHTPQAKGVLEITGQPQTKPVEDATWAKSVLGRPFTVFEKGLSNQIQWTRRKIIERQIQIADERSHTPETLRQAIIEYFNAINLIQQERDETLEDLEESIRLKITVLVKDILQNKRQSIIKLVAITGALGSGKSETARYLREKRHSVISTDQGANRLLNPFFNQKVVEDLRVIFGADAVIVTNSEVNKVAANKTPEIRRQFDEIMNPVIMNYIFFHVGEAIAKGEQVIFEDSAYFDKLGLNNYVNCVWNVARSSENRAKGLQQRYAREGIPADTSQRLISLADSVFAPEREYKTIPTSAVIILNNGTVEELQTQIDTQLKNMAMKATDAWASSAMAKDSDKGMFSILGASWNDFDDALEGVSEMLGELKIEEEKKLPQNIALIRNIHSHLDFYPRFKMFGQEFVNTLRNRIMERLEENPGKISIYWVGGRIKSKNFLESSDIDLYFDIENKDILRMGRITEVKSILYKVFIEMAQKYHFKPDLILKLKELDQNLPTIDIRGIGPVDLEPSEPKLFIASAENDAIAKDAIGAMKATGALASPAMIHKRDENVNKFLQSMGITQGSTVVAIGTMSDINIGMQTAKLGGKYLGFDLKVDSDENNRFFAKFGSSFPGRAEQRNGIFGFNEDPIARENPVSKDIPDSSVDLIFMMTGVLNDPKPESSPDNVWREAMRVLKPGGRIAMGSFSPLDREGMMVFINKKLQQDKIIKIDVPYVPYAFGIAEIFGAYQVYPGGANVEQVENPENSNAAMKAIDASASPAMNGPGGIDLTSNKFLETQNAGEGIKFHMDPAMLAQLQNAPGFYPVIISIQPMTDLKGFLGINEEVPTVQAT